MEMYVSGKVQQPSETAIEDLREDLHPALVNHQDLCYGPTTPCSILKYYVVLHGMEHKPNLAVRLISHGIVDMM